MASTPQFADLLTVPSQDDVLNQEVLPELTKRNVRLTDWTVGAIYRAFAYVVSLMRVNVRLAIATIMAAGFEDYVFGFATPPPNADGTIADLTGWAPLVAKQRYGIDQIKASYTRRTITLTNASVSSYGPLQPGPILMIQFPSGNRYILDQVLTIPASLAVTAIFRSEFPAGSYAKDLPGSVIQLVTSQYSGVTATNPYSAYTPVVQLGTSIGLVTPSGVPTGFPPAPTPIPHSVVVRIKTTGIAGVATWESNLDNGGWVAQGNSVSVLLGFNITVTLTDNGGAPSFAAGSVFYFATPGSDVTQAGAAAETPQALGLRCRGLWPTLGFAQDGFGNWIPLSPTLSAYQALALSANSQVRVAYVATDLVVNNQVNIVIAGAGGAPCSVAVVANVQAFFNYFSMLTDKPVVVTSAARNVVLGGLSIFCKQAAIATAKPAMTNRLQTYLGSIDPAVALGINGRIDYDYIIALVRTTPGITQVSGTLTINGGAADLQLPVAPGAYESPSWSQAIDSAFNWSAVA